jgi:hypothetical protein
MPSSEYYHRQRDLAKRILDRAAEGVFDVAELKNAALEGLAG